MPASTLRASYGRVRGGAVDKNYDAVNYARTIQNRAPAAEGAPGGKCEHLLYSSDRTHVKVNDSEWTLLASDGTTVLLSGTDAGVAGASIWEPGDFKWSGKATAGLGWLGPCIGQAVSRTTYAALFAAIGTFYGVGDGTSTFGLPNAVDTAGFIGLGGALVFGVAGRTGGNTADLSHLHAQAVHDHAQAVHLHGQTVHSHAHAGTHDHGGDSHDHGAGSYSAPYNHDHSSFAATSGGPSGVTLVETDAPTTNVASDGHSHSVTVDVPSIAGSNGVTGTSSSGNGAVTGARAPGSTDNSSAVNTANSAAVDTGSSAAVNTGTSGAVAQSLVNRSLGGYLYIRHAA